MIGYLEGSVIAVREGYTILSVGGVGYKVAAPRSTLLTLSEGSRAAFWTHLAVREDALDLYGFQEEAELKVFALLRTVSGIGPKSALSILDIASIETLRSAISEGNVGYLTKVSGIGRKTAEKIILELRDKIGLAESGHAHAMKGDEEALEALRSLGYTPIEARDALRKVPMEVSGSNARLREALKVLGGN